MLSLALSQLAIAALISPPTDFFLPIFHFLHLGLFLNCPPPCRFNPFTGINCIFQVSCWQAQRIWFCCGDNCSSAVLLISTALSPFSCCSISSLSVLTEAHFRWSVLLRHVPFSSARTSFFRYPTRPSHPQIYCQCGGWSWLPLLCDVFSLMPWHSGVQRWA